MYCIKCGAHLSDGQTTCPICNTIVYHPDFEIAEKSTYPKTDFKSEEFNYRGLMFVITVLFLIPLLLPVVLDIGWSGGISWSGYVFGGVLLFFISFVLPFWFKKPNPVIFVPCSVAGVVIYLWYICFATGGEWYFPFGLPITLSMGLIVSTMTALFKYLRRGRLYIVGGAFIAVGAWTILVELLTRYTFGYNAHFYWSVTSLGVCFIFGMLMIIIAIVKPFKESLRKIFYVGQIKGDKIDE